MGFGSHAFGSGHFGEYPWGKHVLWKDLPLHYRELDALPVAEGGGGGDLERLVDSIRPLFDGERRRIRDFHDLRDVHRVRGTTDLTASITLGAYSVDSTKKITTIQIEIANDPADRVDVLGPICKGWTLDDGRKRFTVVGIRRIGTASGKPEIDIEGTTPPRGVVEREGTDASVTNGATTVTSLNAKFTSADVSKRIEIKGAATPGNNGSATISTIASPSQVTTSKTFAAEANNGSLTWRVRVADGPVTVRAPAQLPYLAGDYGVLHDAGEPDWRQRGQIARQYEWITGKTTQRAYTVVGNLAGFQFTATQLWWVAEEQLPQIWASTVHEMRDDAPFQGLNGSFVTVSGKVCFRSPTAAFRPFHVGRMLRVYNATTAANNGKWKIDERLDANTVRLTRDSGVFTEDAKNGSIEWALVKSYTTLAPLRMRFDEIAADAIPADTFAWEGAGVPPSYAGSITVAQLTASSYRITWTGASLSDISDVGTAYVSDSAGRKYFLETVPAGGGPWTFDIFTVGVAPTAGAATVSFEVDAIESETYLAASALLLEITTKSAADDPAVSCADFLDRALRKALQALGIHERVVVKFIQEMTATLELSATITTP